MRWQDRITTDSAVLVEKPVIKGTRLAVELLANGWTEQKIIQNFPGVSQEDISACLHYAIDILKSERSIPCRRSHEATSKRKSPLLVVDAQRTTGHDALWARSDMCGETDHTNLRRAQEESRIIVTLDNAFGELAFHYGLPATCGVILFGFIWNLRYISGIV